MSGVKSRGALVLLGALALVSFHVVAQAPQGGPPRGGMGMMGAADRPTTIERMGLNDASLKLTAAQKAEIDKIVDAYLVEQKTLREKYPMTQGGPPSQEAMTAMRGARDNLNAALGKVLNEQQRTAWQAAQAARRPTGGPGGPGGAGGPPPGR